MTKTYHAPGLLDLQLVLHAGKAWTTVHFTGGRLSGYGEYQASYTTSDPAIQTLIEKSRDFLSGRIRLGAVVDDSPAVSYPSGLRTDSFGPYAAPAVAHRGPGRPRKNPPPDYPG